MSEDSFDLVDPESIIRGDLIGMKGENDRRLTVEDIDAPQPYGVTGTPIHQWTFHGPDTDGKQRATTFREGDKVKRFHVGGQG